MTDKNDFLNTVLSEIETTLSGGQFTDSEYAIVELKDLSTGSEWTSLRETVCAYLNTNGGYLICGIRERNKQYSFPGFDRKNEGRLIELRNRFFKNDHEVLPDLTDYIDFDYRTLMGKTLAIVTVRPLSDDQKFLKFDGVYYERVLTQDKVIPPARLIQHREYKAELEYSKEISVVPQATLHELDIEKINQFIIRLNTTGKKETVKKDLPDASDFLRRRYCLTGESSVTLLGLLLFGKDPAQHAENRARLDGYFETRDGIGRDKKYFEGDILSLMDDAYAYVWGHIKVGRSAADGGKSEPEYPADLIREAVNNALAHRDYSINAFVTIKINPGDGLEISNPGSFKQKMILNESFSGTEIRRIVPGVAESKNPKLAHILKSFDKIESQGIGMATLVSACLENQIDVPYYDLSVPDRISLVIPSGKLMDDDTQRWAASFNLYMQDRLGGRITPEHIRVLAYLLKSERLNQQRHYTILLSRNNNHFDVLADLKQAGLVQEHPGSSSVYTPVYVLDQELKMVDFASRIETLTGKPLTGLDPVALRVLNIIYRYNHYNRQPVKPNAITPELYAQLYGKKIDPTTYESLGRKVRRICGDLLAADLLSKTAGKAYEIRKG